MSKNKNKNGKAPAPKAAAPAAPATPTFAEQALDGTVSTSHGTAKVIDFYKHRFIYFAISIAIVAVGIIAACVNGIKLDINFQGGTILKYTYEGTLNIEKTEDIISEILGKEVNCLEQTTVSRDEQLLVVNVAGNEALTSSEQTKVTDALEKSFPDSKLDLSESLSVEPFTGARFFREGLLAIAISFGLILVYVGIRFRKIGGFSAGTMAIIALLHDTFVVAATFFIFQIPLNDEFIAAVLTIIGFSINDTIVIYDRIRENKTLMGPKVPTEVLVNTSITQSMSRSINTNIAVFISITIVFIFAQAHNIESIKDFALPMMFGTISGCYSTICIAGPLWTMYKNHQAKKKALNA